MTWYGGNDGGIVEPLAVGDLVRYDDGPSALMRIESVRFMGTEDKRGIGVHWRYYGRAFHSTGCCTGRYHGQCRLPSDRDRRAWAWAHDRDDAWIPGRWGYVEPSHVVLAVLSPQGRSYSSKPLSRTKSYRMDPEGTEATTYERLIIQQGARIVGRWLVRMKNKAA